jgi:hypothetical protein
MKPSGVQRDVRTLSAARQPGSAPNVGKVARMRGFGQLRDRHRRRRDSHRDERNQARSRLVVGWSIAIGVVSLVALLMVVGFWVRPLMKRKKDTTEQDRVAADAQVRVASKFKSPSEDEILVLVKKALALRNPAEVDRLIRPGPIPALEVVDFLKALKTVDGEIAHYVWLGSIDKNGLSLEGVQVVFGHRDKPRNRLAILTPDENGVWKMDFAAFARCVTPSWEDLLAKKTESGVVRVYVARDNYFNGPFADYQKWAAYSMVSPDMDEKLVGYCKVASSQHRAMESLWTSGDVKFARVTLEINRVENSDRRQFEITHVLAEDWVMGEKPLDAE